MRQRPHDAGGAIEATNVSPLGRHVLLDLYDCRSAALDDPAELEELAVAAVRASGGTVLGRYHKHFEPHGVTVLVLVAESHFALHTWPEHRFAAVDYFTCGTRVDPERAAACIEEALRPGRRVARDLPRGESLPP